MNYWKTGIAPVFQFLIMANEVFMRITGSISPVKRVLLLATALVVLFGLWYVFRPEKLFINKRVDEAPPTLSKGQPTPLFTGRFQGERHKTTGRVTVYQRPDGTRYLQLTDFSTSSGRALHVLLVNGNGIEANKDFALTSRSSIDMGELKNTQGDQRYALAPTVDLNQFDTAAIYSADSHSNFGIAKLESF